MSKSNVLCSWSGGKDSCFGLMKAIGCGHWPKVLLSVLNEEGKISRSHGIPSSILQEQANSSGLPIHLISSSWKDYEVVFTKALQTLSANYQLTHAVFGDIDLEAHKDWEEKVCNNSGLAALLPLWKQNRKKLVYEMLEAGIKTIIVSCNEVMGEDFLGKELTFDLVAGLEKLGVDPCGENGEYHTLVLDCPLFEFPINVRVGEKIRHDNYWFCQLTLVA